MGSPRLITNENGAVTKRQDFGAFGDETLTAARASGLGYTSTDELRQDYTGYQKDNESGLEYAQARYYNTAHGRFTSVDPLTASATIRDPQSFNRYSYVLNSPYKFTDPLGLLPLTSAGACGACGNSYVDGSAFRGRDSSMIANMSVTLYFMVLAKGAIDIVKSPEFLNRISNDLNKTVIVNSLVNILTNGNNDAISLISDIVYGGTTFAASPGSHSGTAGIVNTPTNIAAINAAIKDGSMGYNLAFGFMQINIDKAEFNNSISTYAAVEGNLIHEAQHLSILATTLVSLATGNPKKYQNETETSGETRAKTAAAVYKIHMAKGDLQSEYIRHGQHPGVSEITSSGTVNTKAISNMASGGTGNVLKSFQSLGIKWKGMLASY